LIAAADLDVLLPDFLPRQRWYGAADRELARVHVIDLDIVRDTYPVLAWTLVEATFADGTTAVYQVPIGLRPLEQTERFLEGKGRSMLGDLDTDAGPALVYDALVDPDLALDLLALVAPGEPADRVRPLNVEQSNTSVVYDERIIMKVFRRVAQEPNPDVEVTDALARVGFDRISAPIVAWQRDGRDLAVVREYLTGGTEGWALALTSLRDVYDSRLDPEEAGGDFAPEAHRLGTITASMHLALADAFDVSPGQPGQWAAQMAAELSRSPASNVGGVPVDDVTAMYDGLRAVTDAGASIRVHGDYHLGQIMRTDAGWFILDFEGEPARPVAERRQPSSPLRDVAGMLRSFQYAAEVALLERGDESTDDDELRHLGGRWQQHVADAFCRGYFETDGIAMLLPAHDDARRVVLDAFLVAKAVYEVGYEIAHRPDWVRIPLAAINEVVARRPSSGIDSAS
jgi:maltokinase